MSDELPTGLSPQVVSVLQALAQPTRLRIIDLVSQAGPEGVAAGAIAKAVSAPASTLSFHLKELAQAGILEARPEGRFIYYAARSEALAAVAAFVARWVPAVAAAPAKAPETAVAAPAPVGVTVAPPAKVKAETSVETTVSAPVSAVAEAPVEAAAPAVEPGKPARRSPRASKPKAPARDEGQLSIFGE
ncbi:MAG: helix-turn-helix transcriptional regulator [Steroidobacteraceae bacterium]|nr:helix-turn-helix transcriptional regulator [Steroidobacteraceae bacterium]